MTRILCSALLVLGARIFSDTISGNEALSEDLQQLLRVTDLVVVGIIDEATHHQITFPKGTKASHIEQLPEDMIVEIHKATIKVREVLRGKGFSGERLSFTWVTIDFLESADLVDLAPYLGREVILFLTRQRDGSVTMNDKAAVIETADRGRVEAVLGLKPVHFECRPAYSGHPVEVTLQFINSTDTSMTLPGIEMDEGRVTLDPRFELRLQANPTVGPWLEPLPGAVTFGSVPEITIAPGETWSIDLVLDILFPIRDEGFHSIELQVESLPPQDPCLFLHFPKSPEVRQIKLHAVPPPGCSRWRGWRSPTPGT